LTSLPCRSCWLRAGEGTDQARTIAEWALQQLIELEATERIGAGRYERADARVTERNGHRPRVVSTLTGDLHLGIPKLRKGSFFPSLLEPRRRIDQTLHAVIMEAYVNSVSTRSVDDLAVAMGIDSGISKSEVSRICAGIAERVGAFRNRTLGHVGFPYVYLDATYVNVRDDALGQAVSRAVVIATGITANDDREVLGVDIGDSEDETFWGRFLRSLKDRGLARLVISDAHSQLRNAIRRHFQGAAWQRYRVHFARNLLACVPKAHQEMVAALLRSIFALTDPHAVAARRDEATTTLKRSSPTPRNCCATPSTTCSPSRRSLRLTGARSGPTTPSSGSTRRSSAARESWRSSPTMPPPCGSSAPSSPTNTTSGPSLAATSPKPPRQSSAPHTTLSRLSPPNSNRPAKHTGEHAHPNPTTPRNS
jgi:transposase-like protein